MDTPALFWFRDDLRLADNPALTAAAEAGPVLCLYVIDEGGDRRPLGGAARWWLSRSLRALSDALAGRGATLAIMRGDPEAIIPRLVAEAGIGAVFWNRRYDGAGVTLDTALKQRLREAGVAVTSCNASLLNEPWEVKTVAGTPMKVFTPYWRAARAKGEPPPPEPAPTRLRAASLPEALSASVLTVDELDLEPTKPDWAGGLRDAWQPGEEGARERLSDFLDEDLRGYAGNRDRPDRTATSRLSPHLRFGEIGPRQIWHATQHAVAGHAGLESDADKFLTEVGWREFSYSLLFHNPDLASANYDRRFDAFPWRRDAKVLRAWQRGMTGYPLVDAGMRELWTTGWMHNRVRMIAASFLIKHLLLDWREGEAWFWDTLVDADPANNPASWQWVAGSGADAAPYFRIFNPVTQGRKFDPAGDYVRRWLPEIAALPDKHIHDPADAPREVLDQAGVTLGETYPRPVISLAAGRARALDALESLSGK